MPYDPLRYGVLSSDDRYLVCVLTIPSNCVGFKEKSESMRSFGVEQAPDIQRISAHLDRWADSHADYGTSKYKFRLSDCLDNGLDIRLIDPVSLFVLTYFHQPFFPSLIFIRTFL